MGGAKQTFISVVNSYKCSSSITIKLIYSASLFEYSGREKIKPRKNKDSMPCATKIQLLIYVPN